ncbi:MAG: 50S ribosomal protein L15 [Zetaproteobacteria bacterium]|nr:50S ribosomal protein L15 [Pseudobdellovibrionaceae bacterium]|tara:strand:+ start:1783 stop:2235 length:453 start_codon:yes stop_codon:yes gene_type:complete
MTTTSLENLSPANGSHKSRKRIGRGIGSGTGKTAGKGHKGQKARKGSNVALGFEGGQTPLYRRLPKFGFSNARFATPFKTINLSQLNSFSDGETVTPETLVKHGLIKNTKISVKVLANGKLERKLNIEAGKFSKTAIKAIESMGGTAKEI